MNDKISHSGVIESIEDGHIKVRIVQSSACAACKVAAHCNASEMKVKVVDVYTTDASSYGIGQEVDVCASRAVAGKALLLGFGLPFVVMVITLVIVLQLTSNEGLAALCGIGALIPYYILLWLMRRKVSGSISFFIDN